MANIKSVGDNIRKLRIDAGLTQEELAFKSGLSQGYINQLESGKRRFTQKSLDTIARALVISINDLFKVGNTLGTPASARTSIKSKSRRPNKQQFYNLLDSLPDHIVDHYLTLLKIEKGIWERRKV